MAGNLALTRYEESVCVTCHNIPLASFRVFFFCCCCFTKKFSFHVSLECMLLLMFYLINEPKFRGVLSYFF